MNLGTFTGSYAGGCDGPIARDYIAPVEKERPIVARIGRLSPRMDT